MTFTALEQGAPPPRFSVVMPAFDAAASIGRAVQSVMAQTLGDWELIVVDDGSSDGTAKLVEGVRDSRVRLLRQPHSGLPAAARNRGIREARGDYVAFLDADDVWCPQKLKRIDAHLTARPGSDVVAHDVWVMAAGAPRRLRAYRSDGSDFLEQLAYRGNFLSTSAMTVRRATLLESGLFPVAQGEPMAEDYALWLELAERGADFAIVPEVLGEYHMHRVNLSRDVARVYASTLRQMDAQYRVLAAQGRLNERRALLRLARTRGALARDAGQARAYGVAVTAALRLPFALAASKAAYRSLRLAPPIGVEARTIVFVNNFAGPGLGGGEVQLLQLIRGCSAAGMGVRLLHAGNDELAAEARRAGAAVRRIPLEPWAALATLLNVRRHLAGVNAAIVQGTGFYTNVLCRLASAGLPVRVVNVVHVVPGAMRLDGGSSASARAREFVDRICRRRVAAYVAVSAAVRDGLIANGVPPRRVTMIHNGIDAGVVAAAAAGPAPRGVPQTRPLVGVVARLEPVKGVEFFVRAAADLLEEGHAPGFAVAGSGSQETALRSLAAALGLNGRIAWLGHVAAVAPLLAETEIVVLPSLSEGLPMVALEAMSLGLPIVAARVGGIPEVVQDGETGLLVPPADHRSLAAAIGALLVDAERARTMGRAGRDRVQQAFSVESMVDGYLSLYRGLLS